MDSALRSFHFCDLPSSLMSPLQLPGLSTPGSTELRPLAFPLPHSTLRYELLPWAQTSPSVFHSEAKTFGSIIDCCLSYPTSSPPANPTGFPETDPEPSSSPPLHCCYYLLSGYSDSLLIICASTFSSRSPFTQQPERGFFKMFIRLH